MRKVLPFVLGIFLVIVVGAYWVLNYTGSNKDLATGSPYLITVESGMTTTDIANLLHQTKARKNTGGVSPGGKVSWFGTRPASRPL